MPFSDATTRTARLTEYRPREVRLRRADVDFLLGPGRGVIELVPTTTFGYYRLTAGGFVGVLHAPTVRFVLRPKVPRTNLYHLLDPDAPPDHAPDSTHPELGSEALDFLARRLAAGMRQQAAAGLSRGYVERSDRQPFLQGRLDVTAQVREPPTARDRFHVTRDEFTTDLPVHQFPKATAEAVLASQFVSAATRTLLRDALTGYADVTSACPDAAALAHVPDADRPFLELCRLVAGALKPGEAAGPTAGPGFLIDMERVFERYVERVVRAAAPNVVAQAEFRYHGPVPVGQPTLVGRPDTMIRQAGRVRCAIDAKWKQLDGPPPAADVHQALAYAVGLGCPDVRLVHPGRRSAAWRYDLTEGDVTLTVHTLRVVGPRAACERSARRLGRALN
jgi:5-methylcytosine-specific restriction enzyme subunit McrC